MLDPLWRLALGLLTGMIFGVLLQKGRVAKFPACSRAGAMPGRSRYRS